MPPASTTQKQPIIPHEVRELAEAHGVTESLPALIDVLGEIFPDMQDLEVLLDVDPEIPDDRYILFRGMVPEDVLRKYPTDPRWTDALVRICGTTRMYLFRLSLKSAE